MMPSAGKKSSRSHDETTSRSRKKKAVPARTSIRKLQRALASLRIDAPPENVTRARAKALLTHLAGVDVAILIANNNARYVDANQAAVRLTGYSRPELTRLLLWQLTPVPSREIGLRLWKDFLRRGKMSGRYPVRRRDGTIVQANYFAVANVLPGVHVSALVKARRRRRAPNRKRSPARRDV